MRLELHSAKYRFPVYVDIHQTSDNILEFVFENERGIVARQSIPLEILVNYDRVSVAALRLVNEATEKFLETLGKSKQ